MLLLFCISWLQWYFPAEQSACEPLKWYYIDGTILYLNNNVGWYLSDYLLLSNHCHKYSKNQREAMKQKNSAHPFAPIFFTN